jgi:hypothetical protein
MSIIDNFMPRKELFAKLAQYEAREAGQKFPTAGSQQQEPPSNHKFMRFQHGIVRRALGDAVAPFSIKTALGGNYFFKLVDLTTNTEQLSGFIVGGTPLKTKIPAGLYELRYAVGDTWVSEDEFFGDDTAFAKADTPLSFSVESDRVRGVEVELIRQLGGNLRTSPIKKESF